MVIKKIKRGSISQNSNSLRRAVENAAQFKKEFKTAIVTGITAAFGFLIALAWRDAISTYINDLVARLNIVENAALYNLYVAIAITLVCVVGMMIIARWSAKPEEAEKKKK